ncbi:MAG TPA: kelch repeat-containing protein [Bacteroidia bacterium]|nr:kelch repeat-containing protein [Bacteroidia bacterium]
MGDNNAIPTSAPLYFASAVLGDGTVFVAGGEDNTNVTMVEILATEIYDPVSNSWTIVNPPKGWTQIGDAVSCVLPDGRGSVVLNHNTFIINDLRQDGWTVKTCTSCLRDDLITRFSPIQDVIGIILVPDSIQWLKRFVIARIDEQDDFCFQIPTDISNKKRNIMREEMKYREDNFNDLNDILKQTTMNYHYL